MSCFNYYKADESMSEYVLMEDDRAAGKVDGVHVETIASI